MDEESFDPDRFLDEAHAAGLRIAADGDELVLEAWSEPAAELLARVERHAPTILAKLKEARPKPTVFIVAPEEDFPDMPAFFDRVKHPRPGDMPTYPWVSARPGGSSRSD